MRMASLALCCALAWGAIFAGPMAPEGALPAARAADVAGLKDQLEKGLKARLPADFRFIRRVVALVEIGTLPRELVDSTFLWVRNNRGSRQYLVIYFERILRMRAAKRGIAI